VTPRDGEKRRDRRRDDASEAVNNLPSSLFVDVPRQVVVVDTATTTRRVMESFAIEQVSGERVVSDRIGRPVIKAFNNIFFRACSRKAPRRQ
jgi:hypothetical protein